MTAQAEGLPLLEVEHEETASLLQVGHVITGKVTRINLHGASVEIVCVGSKPLRNTHSGTIRREDVRAKEIDKVEIYKCFRPGDIVRAKVISLGDVRSYFLSTAEDALGVIMAQSEAVLS